MEGIGTIFCSATYFVSGNGCFGIIGHISTDNFGTGSSVVTQKDFVYKHPRVLCDIRTINHKKEEIYTTLCIITQVEDDILPLVRNDSVHGLNFDCRFGVKELEIGFIGIIAVHIGMYVAITGICTGTQQCPCPIVIIRRTRNEIGIVREIDAGFIVVGCPSGITFHIGPALCTSFKVIDKNIGSGESRCQ